MDKTTIFGTAIGLAFIGGIAWVKSGRSPFLWIASAGLHGEAFRRQLIASTIVGAKHLAQNYRQTLLLVKGEMSGFEVAEDA